jgi:hypothetical protein
MHQDEGGTWSAMFKSKPVLGITIGSLRTKIENLLSQQLDNRFSCVRTHISMAQSLALQFRLAYQKINTSIDVN